MEKAIIGLVLSALSWLLLSLGLWKISGKLKWKHRWMTWAPGLRYCAFGAGVDMAREGIFCAAVEILAFVLRGVSAAVADERVATAISLALLVVYVILYIYRIRLFVRLTVVFGVRKRWILLWLIAEWLPIMIFGVGKKYQPREGVSFAESWEAGTAPAQIPGADGAQARELAQSGLSVSLRERTVRDFGKKRYLLKDIDLDIPNGSLVLLLGGSGSGKTTFVNAVIGYEKASATILLNGCDVYRDYERMKYRIGFVPQQNLIRGTDTVAHTVSDAAELRLPSDVSAAARRSKVGEVMELLGLSAGGDGLVSKKSGGQLRRISIAMELVSDPELFVLDEPDSGLDGVIAREMFTKLRGIADEGKIVIVITHTPDRVIDLFDKVIVLARDSGRVGRLAFYGSPQQAREFFGKDTMEGVVMSVNRREEGGDGLADECIERFARMQAQREKEAAI